MGSGGGGFRALGRGARSPGRPRPRGSQSAASAQAAPPLARSEDPPAGSGSGAPPRLLPGRQARPLLSPVAGAPGPAPEGEVGPLGPRGDRGAYF